MLASVQNVQTVGVTTAYPKRPAIGTDPQAIAHRHAMTPAHAAPAPLQPAPGPHSSRRSSADISNEDRDLLFGAITARLRSSVAQASDGPGSLHATVLECVQALEQLQATVVQERGYGRRIERELLQARSALAATRQELLGTQAGERQARHLAQHDSLTTLPNRSLFHTRLNDALHTDDDAAPALAVLFLDLDDFKPINDRHGHDAGDEMLRIVAQRLSRCIRAGDLVCRFGGDEFACLLANPMGRDQLSQLAAKLFDAVSAPVQVGALELTVHPSIGIAMCPSDGHTAAQLLKRADTAMYHAKRRQLGFAFFDRHTDD